MCSKFLKDLHQVTVRHDFEEILGNVKQIIVDNFNTKLLAISADKGDGIVLPPINDNAYFLQSLDEAVANFDPFIAYGISNIETVSLGHQSAEKIFIEVVIVLADNGINDINRIMFRYSRALKEIFEENWQNRDSSTKLFVNRSTVVPFQALDSSAIYKAIGIEIEVNLA